MQTQSLEGGFASPATDASHAFRNLMEAMARPGTIHTLVGGAAPAPLSVAAATTVLTLCDADTPIWLAGRFDTDALRAWIAFHTGAPFSGPSNCSFALGHWADLAPLSAFPIGTPEYPDRSATLIVEVDTLCNEGSSISGPGIRDQAALSLPDAQAFRDNHALFPLGLDFFLTSADRVAAMPRSTEVV